MSNTFLKDPDATLDYAFDWSGWLQSGETISSYAITVDSGITKESDSQSSGVVTVWLSGAKLEFDSLSAARQFQLIVPSPRPVFKKAVSF